MIINSYLSFEGNHLSFALESNVTLNAEAPCLRFDISSGLSMTAEDLCTGVANLPSLYSRGNDFPVDGYGEGISSLPSVYSSGDGGFFIPETLTFGESYMQPLYSAGMMSTSSPGEGETYLPMLQSIGGEGNYGTGSCVIPSISSYGAEGPVIGSSILISVAFGMSGASVESEVVVVLSSTGVITETFEGTNVAVAQVLDQLQAQGNLSVIGVINTTILSEIFGETRGCETLGSEPISFGESTMVWVVNLDNKASSQYDNYGFNGFFSEDGIDYGIAEDGIYSLNGDTDAGAYIEALIEIGLSNFGDVAKKKIPNIYFGVSSDDKMYVKVNADGKEYVYSLRSSSEDIRQHRADIGKGLDGVFWNLTILNKEGCDFALATVSFEPLSTNRKI